MTNHLRNAVDEVEAMEWCAQNGGEALRASEVIARVLPHLERHFRERIMGEIRAELPDPCPNCQDLHNGMVEAIRIVKGENND